MPYIIPLQRSQADAKVGATLDAIKTKLGVLPNMFRTMAQNPLALEAYMQLAGTTAKGKLDARQRESIALAVGEANRCDYCVAAHAALGAGAGLSLEQIAAARDGESRVARDAALLRLAREITSRQGRVSQTELERFKAAGFGDDDLLEVLVNVVLNIYTNYTNHLAGTEIDFPAPPARLAAA